MAKKLTTTQKGLGNEHQKRRKDAVAAFVPGTPCELCGEPMWHARGLDLDHVIPRAVGAGVGRTRLVHRRCNRAKGFEDAVVARGGKRSRRQIASPETERVNGVDKRVAPVDVHPTADVAEGVAAWSADGRIWRRTGTGWLRQSADWYRELDDP